MAHLLHYPTASYFACGAVAFGRRDTRTHCDPANTTCPRCLAWMLRNPEWEPVIDSRPTRCELCDAGDSHHFASCPTLPGAGLTALMREVFE